MRTVLVIGIGAGDPDHLTLQAVAALGRADVFFVIDKGDERGDLRVLREDILRLHRPDGAFRLVRAADPPRERAGAVTDDPSAYRDVVVDWQDRRAAVYRDMLVTNLEDGQAGAFLVWGDPSLYDGTLRLLDSVLAAVPDPDGWRIESVPGISSVAALAAAHRLILNRVGRPVLITTGRRIEGGIPDDADDVVVMLDGRAAFATLPPEQRAGLHVYWGAYLGTADELLVSGPLDRVCDQIVAAREEARARKGWIMDTYLLRRGAEER